MSILSDSATQTYTTQQPFCRCEPGDIGRSAGWAGWAGNLADGVIIIRRHRQPNPPSHNSRWHATFVGFLEYYECYQPNCCSAFPTFPPTCATGVCSRKKQDQGRVSLGLRLPMLPPHVV